MARTTIGLGTTLILLGIGAYAIALLGGDASWTALIPAIIGVPIALLGAGAIRYPLKRKLFIHVALALAVIGLLGSAGGLMKLPKLVTSAGDVERPMAVIVQSIMAVLCLVYVVNGVRSFIAARK